MRVSSQSDWPTRERALGAETDRVTASEPRKEHHGASVIKNPATRQDAEQTQEGEGEPGVPCRNKSHFTPIHRRGIEATVILADEHFRRCVLANLA